MSNCIFMSIKPYSLKAGFISGWRSCGRKVSCVDMFNRFPVPNVSSHSDNSLRNGTCCWNATSLSRISCTPCRCVTGCTFFGSTDGSCGYGSWYCIKYLLFTKPWSSAVPVDIWPEFGWSGWWVDSGTKQQLGNDWYIQTDHAHYLVFFISHDELKTIVYICRWVRLWYILWFHAHFLSIVLCIQHFVVT